MERRLQLFTESFIFFKILKIESKEFVDCCCIHSQESSALVELGLWITRAESGEKYGSETYCLGMVLQKRLEELRKGKKKLKCPSIGCRLV